MRADSLLHKGLGKRTGNLVAERFYEGLQIRKDVSEELHPVTLIDNKIEGVAVRYAKCCMPIYGDPITAHSDTERGIVIHHSRCQQVAPFKQNDSRYLDANWGENKKTRSYAAHLQVIAQNKIGTLADVISTFTQRGINIIAVNTKDLDIKFTECNIEIDIENVDEKIVYIQDETFFDLDNSLISIHLETLKNIKSKTLHREFVNILSNIDLADETIYGDKVIFVIKKLYEIGEIEKAYDLVSKINLESANIDKQNLEFFYLIKLNYLLSSYKLSEVCNLRLTLLEKSINLPKNLLQKSDIFCLTLENKFSEAKLLNSLLTESETSKDENFQKLFNFMLLNENSNSFIPLAKIKSKDLVFLYSAMLRICLLYTSDAADE